MIDPKIEVISQRFSIFANQRKKLEVASLTDVSRAGKSVFQLK